MKIKIEIEGKKREFERFVDAIEYLESEAGISNAIEDIVCGNPYGPFWHIND